MATARKLSGKWKIPQNATPDGRICFCFNLPDTPEHMGIFWGLLDLLALPGQWQSDDPVERQNIANYWLAVIGDNRDCFEEVLAMSNRGCGCGMERIYRLNAAGQYQYSDDGGETWTDSQADPREQNSIFATPAWFTAGEDNRCAATESTIAALQFITNEFCTSTTITAVETIVSLLVTAIGWFMGGPLGIAITQAIYAIALTLFELGQAALCSAMGSFNWDDLRPILFCNMHDDGTYDFGNWNQIKAEIADTFSGDQEFWLWNLVNILGPVGLTNGGRYKNIVGADCSDLGCEPCSVNGIYYITSTAPLTYAKAVEVSPGVVRLHSYHEPTVPNSQYISWKFGNPAQGDNCCRVLGYQNLQNVAAVQRADEYRCDGTTAPHSWPWLGVPVCCFGGALIEFNVGAYSIDLRLDLEGSCP